MPIANSFGSFYCITTTNMNYKYLAMHSSTNCGTSPTSIDNLATATADVEGVAKDLNFLQMNFME